jgi:hypothetical protein
MSESEAADDPFPRIVMRHLLRFLSGTTSFSLLFAFSPLLRAEEQVLAWMKSKAWQDMWPKV